VAAVGGAAAGATTAGAGVASLGMGAASAVGAGLGAVGVGAAAVVAAAQSVAMGRAIPVAITAIGAGVAGEDDADVDAMSFGTDVDSMSVGAASAVGAGIDAEVVRSAVLNRAAARGCVVVSS